MSQVYDLKGDKRNWMASSGRSDPHHPALSRMQSDAEHYEKLRFGARQDGPRIDDAALQFEESINFFADVDDTDSPIEKHLLLVMAFGYGLRRGSLPPIILRRDQKPIMGTRAVQIIPQFKVGVYRLDFAIILACEECIGRIAVECDGHEFHSQTKEQAAHDRQKDRAMASAGWPVFRFTGSEIAKNPERCVSEIDAALNGLMRDHLSAWDHGRKWERDHA